MIIKNDTISAKELPMRRVVPFAGYWVLYDTANAHKLSELIEQNGLYARVKRLYCKKLGSPSFIHNTTKDARFFMTNTAVIMNPEGEPVTFEETTLDAITLTEAVAFYQRCFGTDTARPDILSHIFGIEIVPD